MLWGGRWQNGASATTGEEVEQINSHFSRLGTSSKHMLPEGIFEFVLIDVHCRFSLHFPIIIADSVTT